MGGDGFGEQLPLAGERVVVAMSGGVDSSVAAALLHERGCEVIGITLSLWEDPDPCAPEGGCCTPEDILDARRVCAAIGIRHYLLNYRTDFQEKVLDPFVAAYRAGETPNPCVRCNNHLKFDLLVRRSRELEAAWLATGHYAQLLRDSEGKTRLFRGLDRSKDQSYFLYGTPVGSLPMLCFPLGGMDKDQVRAEGARLGVRTVDKPDSQDVCFIPGGDTAAFVQSQGGGAEPGDIVDEAGAVLGQHPGIHAFTVGQRRGIGVSGPEPLYVQKIDAARRRLVVATADRLESREVWADDWNWLRRPGADEVLGAQIRYRSEPTAVAGVSDDGRVLISLSEAASAVAPGQAVVLYGGPEGAEVLGGGTIRRPPN
ncbi:MAG: tRNA 2-thiouridine(34) synthase MnmA [Myxococcota bacterium]|nr:tRNA 2-thiouridine(34) synthase MnmA [Myxococcota bacterium]